MIAFDLAYELTLGVACGFPAVNRRQRLIDGLVASLVAYVPLCVVTLTVWTDWQAMRPIDRADLPLLEAAQVVALLAAYFAGFALAPLARHLGRRLAIAIAGVLWIALLIRILQPVSTSILIFLFVATALNAIAAGLLLRRALR